jgi:hypothetical protein
MPALPNRITETSVPWFRASATSRKQPIENIALQVRTSDLRVRFSICLVSNWVFARRRGKVTLFANRAGRARIH